MECPHSSEIKAKLLSFRFRLLFQKHRDRFNTDPSYFVFHQASTILALREELGLPFGKPGGCAECEHNTLQQCRVIAVLKEAILERIAKED